MRFLARISLVSSATVAIACWIAIGAGRLFAAPTDARAADMQYCAGSPCMMGIVPGMTPWTTAQADLSRAAGSSASAKQIIILVDAETEVQVFPSVNGVSVGRIYVNLDRPLDAGWIVQRYGKPCGVSIYFDGQMVTLRYPFLLANVELKGARLTSDMPVTFIQYADPNFRLKKQPDLCVDTVTSRQVLNTPWYGFTTIRTYVART